MQGANKLNLRDNSIRIVVEDNGKDVDNSYFDNMGQDKCIIFLQGNEEWEPAPSEITIPLEVYTDKTYEHLIENKKAKKLFQLLLQEPKIVTYLELPELEIIKDAEVEDLGLPKRAIQIAMKLQDMCITVYLKKSKDEENSEFINLLYETNFVIPDLHPTKSQ